jgi:hypothetical protein
MLKALEFNPQHFKKEPKKKKRRNKKRKVMCLLEKTQE